MVLSADSQPHRTSQDRQLMGRHIYSKRLGTVEPVFGNLESNKGLKRFTLRGKDKVNAQWLLYCMVHNIEKIATQGQVMH